MGCCMIFLTIDTILNLYYIIWASLKTPPTLLFCRRERDQVKKTTVFRDAHYLKTAL